MGVPTGLGVQPSKQLRFAAELGQRRAPLTSMRLDIGTDEVVVMRWLLQHCNTEQLASVRVNVLRQRKSQMLISLNDTSAPIDCSQLTVADHSLLHLQPFRVGLQALHPNTSTRAIATFCSAITSLQIVHQVDDVPALATMKSLVHLEAHFLEVDDINYVLAELPRLACLTITGGNIPELASSAIDLASNSLQVLDLTGASKGLTIERIECPSLRQIWCNEGTYGNGLRIGCLDVDGELADLSPDMRHGIDPEDLADLDSTCRFFRHDTAHSGRMDDTMEVEVPLECEVFIGCHPSFRRSSGQQGRSCSATITTTIREYFEEEQE